MKILCLCHTCSLRHTMEFDPIVGPGSGFSDWLTKHGTGHRATFHFPGRSRKDKPVKHSWMEYVQNADVKTAYAASVVPTLTLASLAASSTLLAGRESTAVDNGASNKYLDYLVAGHFKAAAANAQVGLINVAIVQAENDTPTWPSVFDGTDSAETVPLQSVYDQVCKVGASIVTTASNDLVWPFSFWLAGLFSGNVPDQFVIFVSHNAETSTNAWSATESDHAMNITGTYLTVIG